MMFFTSTLFASLSGLVELEEASRATGTATAVRTRARIIKVITSTLVTLAALFFSNDTYLNKNYETKDEKIRTYIYLLPPSASRTPERGIFSSVYHQNLSQKSNI